MYYTLYFYNPDRENLTQVYFIELAPTDKKLQDSGVLSLFDGLCKACDEVIISTSNGDQIRVKNLSSFEDFLRDTSNGTNLTSIDGLRLFKDSDDIIAVSPIDFIVYQDSDGVANLTSINGFEISNVDGNSTFIPLDLIQEFDIIVNNNETGCVECSES